jgi:hypothetical protein
LDPRPTILSEIRLDIEDVPRPERELFDFKLPSEVVRLMQLLDQVRDGEIEEVEIRDGLPRRLVLSARLVEIQQGSAISGALDLVSSRTSNSGGEGECGPMRASRK